MWIDEKVNHLEAARTKDVTSFEDKVKKLQKHQAFMAELQAHESRIKEITENGRFYSRETDEWIMLTNYKCRCKEF